MASETITRNDLTAILNSVLPNPADMTPQEVEDFIDSLLGQGSNIADFVVEEGTETAGGVDWTYRKWNSGIAECWGKWSGTLSHYSTMAGFYAYNTGSINYPSGLFIEEPNAHFSGRIDGGFCLTGTLYSASKDYMSCYALATAGNSQSCVFFIYSIGKWK